MRIHLSAAIKHWSLYRGSKIAVSSDSEVSYRALDNAAEYVSKMIKSQPYSKYITIAVYNKALLIASIIGCSRAERTFILLDPDENVTCFTTIVKSINKCIVITDSKNSAPTYYSAIHIDEQAFHFNDFVQQSHEFFPEAEACVLFTSGTTGIPKGVVRSNFSLMSECVLWIIELGITSHTRFMVCCPLFGTGGFVFMYATLFCSGELIIPKTDDEFELIPHSDKKSVDLAFMFPTQILKLIKFPQKSGKFFTKKVITMGAPISADSKKAFADIYGCEVVEAWGNSEGLGTLTDPEDLHLRPNSIGRPCFCDYIDTLDKDGNPCKPMQFGILAGQSDNQYDHYLHEAGESYCSLKNRLLISEDMGFKDEQGYFYTLGRKDDKIVVDDEDIFPAYIEKIALGHDSILDAAVTQSISKEGKTLIVLLAVLLSTEALRKIMDWINNRLPRNHYISRIIPVENIPRNQGGKIIRAEVIKIYNEFEDRETGETRT